MLNKRNNKLIVIAALCALAISFILLIRLQQNGQAMQKKITGNASQSDDDLNYANTAITFSDSQGNLISVPAFQPNGDGSVIVNNNEPYFSRDDLTNPDPWYEFSDIDDYGRAGVSNAVVGKESMQTKERGSLSEITPSGWYACKANLASDHGVRDGCQRSHLIANKLLGSVSDDKRNLITGSAMFNQIYMLPWEKKVMQACENGLHVRYRVMPVFDSDDGIAGAETAHGVLMEAESIEDSGASVRFCVYVYNAEPGWTCDYLTGEWERIQS